MARIDDYKEAYRLAAEEIRRVNPHRISALSGADCQVSAGGAECSIRLDFLNQEHLVRVGPEVEVVRAQDPGEVHLVEKVLILHYLLNASGEPLRGNLITYRQIPGGAFYYSAFQRRARDPLLQVFGQRPDLLPKCGTHLGATPASLGDVAITVPALPRVPINLVLWRGDEEFPPEASILFDETIGGYLPAEDIAVLSGMVVYRLMSLAREVQE